MNPKKPPEHLSVTELELANDDMSNVAQQVENDRKENELQSYVLVAHANLRKQPTAMVELIQYLNSTMANYDYTRENNHSGREVKQNEDPNDRQRRDRADHSQNRSYTGRNNPQTGQGKARNDRPKGVTSKEQGEPREYKQYSRE